MIQKDYNIKWDDIFKIDNSSPSGLLRIRDIRGNIVEGRFTGSKAFRKNGDPRGWQVGFQGKIYSAHRIIWVLVHRSIDPELIIDHIDGNPFNNKIENLRLTTLAVNSRNVKLRPDNVTGITGVILQKDGHGYWYYVSCWSEGDGVAKGKWFSINKYGEDNAKTLAINYRNNKIIELNLNGAGYTERHGV